MDIFDDDDNPMDLSRLDQSEHDDIFREFERYRLAEDAAMAELEGDNKRRARSTSKNPRKRHELQEAMDRLHDVFVKETSSAGDGTRAFEDVFSNPETDEREGDANEKKDTDDIEEIIRKSKEEESDSIRELKETLTKEEISNTESTRKVFIKLPSYAEFLTHDYRIFLKTLINERDKKYGEGTTLDVFKKSDDLLIKTWKDMEKEFAKRYRESKKKFASFMILAFQEIIALWLNEYRRNVDTGFATDACEFFNEHEIAFFNQEISQGIHDAINRGNDWTRTKVNLVLQAIENYFKTLLKPIVDRFTGAEIRFNAILELFKIKGDEIFKLIEETKGAAEFRVGYKQLKGDKEKNYNNIRPVNALGKICKDVNYTNERMNKIVYTFPDLESAKSKYGKDFLARVLIVYFETSDRCKLRVDWDVYEFSKKIDGTSETVMKLKEVMKPWILHLQ